MNNARRKSLSQLIGKLEAIKIDLEEIKESEQDALDNLPENMHESEQGQAMQSAIDAMDSADSEIGSAMDSIQEAMEA
jgi:uncharacterized phage infection (PIP) family protein YhgE